MPFSTMKTIHELDFVIYHKQGIKNDVIKGLQF